MSSAETIENIKSSRLRSKKEIKERTLKLAEDIDEAESVDLEEDCDSIMCAIENSRSKVKAKIRK